MNIYRTPIIVSVFAFLIFTVPADTAHAAFTDTPTNWNNFLPPSGFTTGYTFNGQPVHDEEGSQDSTNGGTGVQPSEVDLASASPNGANPGPYDTPSYGYYDGGTPYDSDDPSTMEDDYILFTMRIDGDPRSKDGFSNNHWNILLDVDADGYKEYWIDLYGKFAQKGPDQLQILYDNGNQQNIESVDTARVEEFSAYNSDTFATSHTRARPATDPSGTTDWFIDIQIPMTAFNDLNGNQVLYPDSPVGFVYSTGASDNDPLQKDFMTDLDFLSLNDPINFGDVVKPNGEPILYFSDNTLEEVDFYNIGDDVHLYLKDPKANSDPDTVQTISVTVSDPLTGDDEVVTLTESGPNTGIFSNLGGVDNLDASGADTAWIPYVRTSVIAENETWTATYNGATDSWDITGSVSGYQGSATAGTGFTSANGAVTFTIYESSTPTNGDTITFDAHAGDRLPTIPTNGIDNDVDNDGNMEVQSGDTLSYSYNSSGFGTLTDTAQVVGTGEPFIQFTRANGLPSNNFELVQDDLYVTVYYHPSTDASDPNYDPNYDPTAEGNTVTVDLVSVDENGNVLVDGDTQTLTLAETEPGSGIFINETGLDTGLAPAAPSTPTGENGTWESIDQGRVQATFTRNNGDTFDTTAELFYTAAAGRVYFTNGAGTQDISQYSPGEPIFIKVTDEPNLGSVQVTVQSDTGDSEIVTLYETAPGSGIYMNRTNDLTTTAGSAQVSSPSTDFSGFNPDDDFVIATGPDTGTYQIETVAADGSYVTLKNLDGTPFSASETRTDIGFNADPLMTETYDGAYGADGVMESNDQNSLTVSYTDSDDGDNDPGNNVKTDEANYNAPSIVINEVLFYEDPNDIPVTGSATSKYEYIQLLNSAASSVTLTGYSVRDEDGLIYTIPQDAGSDISLGAGEKAYIVLRPDLAGPAAPVYDSASGTWYFYATQAEGATLDMLSDPGDADPGDQLTLYNASGQAVDFVAWSTTSSNTIDWQSDDFNAVNTSIWTDNDYKDVGANGTEGLITQGQVITRATDGFDSNTPSDWVYAASSLQGDDIGPTYAVISSFSAYADGGQVVVEWRTAVEIGTAGFHLFRKEGTTGSFDRLNEQILPALPESPTGGTYHFVDETARPEETYTYKIREVEYGGKERNHGPFTVTVGPPPEGFYDDPEAGTAQYTRKGHQISAEKKARNEAAKIARKAAKEEKKRRKKVGLAKIYISKTGLYYMPAKQMADLLGLPLPRVENRIRQGGISLFNRGEQVAWHPGADNGGLYFYGQKPKSRYSRENVYWLKEEKGLMMEVIEPRPRTASLVDGDDALFDRVSVEEVNRFPAVGLFTDADVDFWMWDYIFAGNPYIGSKTFNIGSAGVASDHGATLKIHFKGANDDPDTAQDHHAVIRVNGVNVGEGYWNGRDSYELALFIPPGVLGDGENEVEIVGQKDTGAAMSIFYLDRFELHYKSHYRAENNQLFFNSEGNDPILVSGLTTPEAFVIELSDPRQPKWLSDVRADTLWDGYSMTIRPPSGNTDYFMAGAASVATPDNAWPDTPSDLASPEHDESYIVIAPDHFFEEAQVLVDHRRGQGLKTLLVNVEDVMDEFNGGLYSPLGIHHFLQHAFFHWSEPPEYVLLAGSGTLDYKDNKGVGDNLIPPLMTGTPYGIFATDTQLADVSGEDAIPEMAIGRIPASTSEELAGYVEKMIGFENDSGAGWARNVLMLADYPDPDAGMFPENSDQLISEFPPEYITERIYLSERSLGAARQTLIDRINTGAGYVNYIGHASDSRLSNRGLLTTAHLAYLTNGFRLPVVSLMTCLVGRYDFPGWDSLGEALITKADGGAAAVWAASGLSLNHEAVVLASEFYRRTFTMKSERLGNAIVETQRSYGARGRNLFMLEIFNLLGDPALLLK